jgi:hypothetical protein
MGGVAGSHAKRVASLHGRGIEEVAKYDECSIRFRFSFKENRDTGPLLEHHADRHKSSIQVDPTNTLSGNHERSELEVGYRHG